MRPLKVAILIVSDTCSKDASQDTTGGRVAALFKDDPERWTIAAISICADEIHLISEVVQRWSDDMKYQVIVTAGGTGFAKRDVTPEAVRPLLDKEAPGLVHAMYLRSFQITPLAAMARLIAGVRKSSLIVCVPGSPKAATENIEAIVKLLPHASDLATEAVTSREVHARGTSHIEVVAGVSPVRAARAISHACHGHHREPDTDTDRRQISSRQHQSNDLTLSVTERARSSPYTMWTVSDAIRRILDHSNVGASRDLSIRNTSLVDHIVSKDLIAVENVPAYRASVVDGYATVTADGPGIYPVVSISHASPSSLPELKSGQITRITTGAPLPPGSDAVVMVEDTKLVEATSDGGEELTVEIQVQTVVDNNIREIGSDVHKGAMIMRKGERISGTGGEIGLLASVGITEVAVYTKPTVGILSTGDELVEPDNPRALANGEIRDSNRASLLAVVSSWGYSTVDLGIAKDQPGDLESILRHALDSADVIITTGGVSMGEKDLLKPTIERALEGTIHFGRVAMKPGKPTTFATIPHQGSSKLIFALPGNPASALVTFHLFVLPSLRSMAGHKDPELPRLQVQVQQEITLDSRPEFHRVMIRCLSDGRMVAESTGMQRSSRVGSLRCNGLLCLPAKSAESQKISANSMVEAILIDSLGSPP